MARVKYKVSLRKSLAMKPVAKKSKAGKTKQKSSKVYSVRKKR
jgi:hypothetical protein